MEVEVFSTPLMKPTAKSSPRFCARRWIPRQISVVATSTTTAMMICSTVGSTTTSTASPPTMPTAALASSRPPSRQSTASCMLVSVSELDIIPIRFAITTASLGPTTSASGGTISSENPNPLNACANEAAPASTTTAASSTQSIAELARRRGVRATRGAASALIRCL